MNKNLSLGGISVEVTHNDLVLLHEMGQLLKRKARLQVIGCGLWGKSPKNKKTNTYKGINKMNEPSILNWLIVFTFVMAVKIMINGMQK